MFTLWPGARKMTQRESGVKIRWCASICIVVVHAIVLALVGLERATMIMAVFALVTGLWMVIWPGRRVEQIETRIRSGYDRFHEEQRSYAAYPWLRSAAATRRWGWLLIIAGCGAMVLRALR
jgi:hypothetical protein